MIEWIGLGLVILGIFIVECLPEPRWGYRPKNRSTPPGPPPKTPGSVSPRKKEDA